MLAVDVVEQQNALNQILIVFFFVVECVGFKWSSQAYLS